MKSNVGLIDRIVRIIIVAVIFYAYYVGWISGLVAMAAAAVAVVFLATAFTGDCFLYRWLEKKHMLIVSLELVHRHIHEPIH